MSEPGELSETVAAVVRAVPGVTDLHAGVFGEVATYLPGRRVRGVRITEEGADLHIVTSGVEPLVRTVDRVRAAVAPLVTGRVDVTVEDVAVDLPAADPAPQGPVGGDPTSGGSGVGVAG